MCDIPEHSASEPGGPTKGFSRTSDIVGAHVRRDLDAYLTLIRRKIQEKVGTTQDLIQQIRRNKIGDSGHVTPNEFRYTLIKFGVILPQPLVDRIFNVFDSDRSGTMDFDEFAMWIMNSEFRPPIEETEGPAERKARITKVANSGLHAKLNKCIRVNAPVFKTMKKTVSFTEWVSIINRGNMPMSERDARAIFLLFDPTDTGFMSAKHLLNWAETGDLTPPPKSAASKSELPDISLTEAIRKVAGKNLQMVERSFIHMPQTQTVRVPFEEFRRCLLSNGLGSKVGETRQLFNALGGKKGTADISQLMAVVANRSAADPQALVSMKKERNQSSNVSAADRALREAIRKSYKEVKAAIEACDKGNTGFINVQELNRVMQRLCIPLSPQDFRYVIQHIHGLDHGQMVNISHFLEAYNPRNLPHQLAGGKAVIDDAAGRTLMSPINTLRHAKDTATSRSASDLDAEAKKGLSINADMKKVDPTGELRRIWQGVLRECHRQDPERSGCVKRMSFINALDTAKAGVVMSPETMSKLADKFDAGYGLVNYLACFRNYLSAMTSTHVAPEKKSAKPGDTGYDRGQTTRENRALHPWEFNYEKRAHKQPHPYWSTATSAPKDVNADIKIPLKVPDANTRAAHQLTTAEKQAALAPYNEKVLQACKKIWRDLGSGGPAWKQIRNEFKKQQIIQQRGCILTTKWYALAEEMGVKLSINYMGAVVRAFRGLGNQDVVRFNDLVRVCTIVAEEQ